jgi:hypothetical protein
MCAPRMTQHTSIRYCCNDPCLQARIIALHHWVQNLLSSILLSTNIKVKIYRTMILPVDLYGCVTWSLTLVEERRLRVCENKVLRGVEKTI